MFYACSMAIFPMLAKYTMHATCDILVKKVSHGGATTKTLTSLRSQTI